MTADPISPDLKTVLKRLRLGRMIDTLPERVVLARQQKISTPSSCSWRSATKCRAATARPPSLAPSVPGSIPPSSSVRTCCVDWI